MHQASSDVTVDCTAAASAYTFRLDAAEFERYRAMAHNGERHERELWQRAGIVSGATVVDLGCGPGALLPALARLVGPDGSIIAVDADPGACATAARSADRLSSAVRVIRADAAATGLPPGSVDVVMCRNVLVHNGRRADVFLAHIATLLRPGGSLVSVEPDLIGLHFEDAPGEREYERRWQEMMRSDGNDPALGHADRLARLLRAAGWQVRESLTWIDRLEVERSPAWAAAETIEARHYATRAELDAWRAAMGARIGPLRCRLPMTVVRATP